MVHESRQAIPSDMGWVVEANERHWCGTLCDEALDDVPRQ